MKKKFTFIVILSLTLTGFSQTFIDDIKVGQRMPDKIRKGGFSEQNSDNCSCRIFSINHNESYGATSGELGKVLSIFFNPKDSMVDGILKVIIREDNEVAKEAYNNRLSDFIRTKDDFKRTTIKVRDSNNGVVDGIYYFIYSFDNGSRYKAIGVIENTVVEETYKPKSSYRPKLLD